MLQGTVVVNSNSSQSQERLYHDTRRTKTWPAIPTSVITTAIDAIQLLERFAIFNAGVAVRSSRHTVMVYWSRTGFPVAEPQHCFMMTYS